MAFLEFLRVIYTTGIVNKTKTVLKLETTVSICADEICDELIFKVVKVKVCPERCWVYSHGDTNYLVEPAADPG